MLRSSQRLALSAVRRSIPSSCRMAVSVPVPPASEESVRRNQDPDAVAVVVGGSRGIGLAMAEQLATRFGGSKVFVTGRNPAAACEQLTTLLKSHSGKVEAVPMDLGDESSVQSAVAKISEATGGRVDILINTVGILHDQQEAENLGRMPERNLQQITPEWMMRNFVVNTMGPALVIKHFSPLMHVNTKKEGSRPRSVIATLSARVGSISDNGMGGWYSYRVSKAGQNQLTKTASLELKRKGCIVVALHPGTVKTSLSAPFHANVKPEKLFEVDHAAKMLLDVVDSLEASDTGEFYDFSRAKIPW
uniref:Uncharacterized protein n=1 Tax=Hemiselmis andersenii TaxID=464988 RepID=A0A6U5BBV0_HEMAN|mmetsp:Transcript_33311/g.78003  ORF Transcript_33311/g.78003 Transcript_33311/m.78003 type:complete len:305 (+) Transcript_33311:198-1112(+)